MQAAGIERGLASISHDGEYAVAHVALELGGATAHSNYAALELYQAPVQKPGESAASTL